MSWFKELFKSVTTGEGLATKLIDTVTNYIPSSEDKARLSMELSKIAHDQEKELLKIENEADKEFNSRIKEMEGTASDLVQAGWVGRFILLARGAQRPAWGWLVIILDAKLYLTGNELSADEMQLLYVLNILVGSFLFGERAIKNVAPFIKEMLQARKK